MKQTHSATEIQALLVKAGADRKVSDNQKLVAEITHLVNRYLADGKRPLHAYCIVSGKKCAMTAKALFASRLKKAGGIIALMTGYRSRGVKATNTKVKMEDGTTVTVKVDPNDENAFRQFKTRMPDGKLDWFWRDPKYARTSVNGGVIDPDDMTPAKRLEFHRSLVKFACQRPDLSIEAKCIECRFAYICQLSVRKFKSDSGRVTNEPNKTMVKEMRRNWGTYHVPVADQVNDRVK